MGKSLDMLQGAFRNLSEPGTLIRFCLVVAKVNQAIYLLVDHYVWMTKTGLVKANSKELAKLAAKFWLVTLLANLVRNLYDIVNIVAHEKQRHRLAIDKRNGDVREVEGVANGNVTGTHQVAGINAVTSVLKIADLFLPLSSLKYIGISDGTQGILGMISSYMGILTVWDPTLKMVPS